jgi:hypothetical protein
MEEMGGEKESEALWSQERGGRQGPSTNNQRAFVRARGKIDAGIRRQTGARRD